jgi:SAM-dependent methyltransferase
MVDVFHDRARPRPDGVRGVNPSVLADGRALPFRAGSFGLVLIDSPWSKEWTRKMYALREQDYPTPDALLRESVRVCRPGGFVGIMHLVIPPTPLGTVRVARLNVVALENVTGSRRLRRFTVYQKHAAGEPVHPPADVAQTRTRSRRSRRRALEVNGSARPSWTLASWGVDVDASTGPKERA